MTAKEFNLEKKRWNKLKAENILLKLMNNKQIKNERRKNSQIKEIRIGNEQFLWNIEVKVKEGMLPPSNISNKLSNALFNALHKNIEVNQSAYKKKKTETKLVSAGNVIGDAFRRRRERR